MSSCFACKRTRNKINKEQGFSFHRIPRVEDVYKQWINFLEHCGVEIEKLKPDSVLCSGHFEKDCFFQYLRSRQLKETAVPTINIIRKASAKKKVAEILCNVLENSKNKYEDPDIPSSHIPVIAKNLDLEDGVCVLSDDNSFLSSTNDHVSFSFNTQKPLQNIDLKDDDTPRKKYLKTMNSSLVNENTLAKKKVKILNQKIRRQKKTIVSLKGVIKVLNDQLLLRKDQIVQCPLLILKIEVDSHIPVMTLLKYEY